MLLSFIGTTEVVVILIIALLVFGPQKLPEVGRQIGSLYQELNRMRGDVQRALDLNEYTNYDSNPYSKGYTYDTPADQDDLHEYHTPQIEAPTTETANMVAPPGPQGTVASSSPFAARSAESEWNGDDTTSLLESNHQNVTSEGVSEATESSVTVSSAEQNSATMHKETNQS